MGGMVYNDNMAESFYFYDLETSGLDPRVDRVMQFAGQRTDRNFKPIGKTVKHSSRTRGRYASKSWGDYGDRNYTTSYRKQDGMSEREFCDFIYHE